jgi:ubiquitin-like protein Pup
MVSLEERGRWSAAPNRCRSQAADDDSYWGHPAGVFCFWGGGGIRDPCPDSLTGIARRWTMAEQERKAKQMSESEQPDAPAPAASTKLTETGAKIKKSLDEVIDEIDGILEENAEEFVKSYVQRGGE